MESASHGHKLRESAKSGRKKHVGEKRTHYSGQRPEQRRQPHKKERDNRSRIASHLNGAQVDGTGGIIKAARQRK